MRSPHHEDVDENAGEEADDDGGQRGLHGVAVPRHHLRIEEIEHVEGVDRVRQRLRHRHIVRRVELLQHGFAVKDALQVPRPVQPLLFGEGVVLLSLASWINK